MLLDQAPSASTVNEPTSVTSTVSEDAVPEAPPVVQLAEVMGPKTAGATGFRVKVTETGSSFRFEPARYPREPRFWCIAITRCSAAGEPDPVEPTWIGEAGLSWNEIGPLMNEIRADVVGWLEAPNHRDVLKWMITQS